ncbi:hypothetical protein QT972_30015 [Microcoleus sp. herbarium7]|uniref:hypothetical protein n=1 Tax=Microcoleus sp. herbarium7 TaxID=3055435 RepID=UPI002FD18C5B
MGKPKSESNWKWGQSSANAFDVVAGFFGVVPKNLVNIKDADAKKLLQQADVSDVQVKRTQDAVQATKKLWRNQSKIGAMIHGLVRNGMQHILTQRRQEATTTKEYAKLVTTTSILSAKINTAVQKTHLKGAKDIEQTGKDLNRYQGELTEQYQTIDTSAEQQSQQRRVSYRDRAQKRLTANSRPWRNY